MDSSAALTLLELLEYHKDVILSTSLGIPTGKLKTKWKKLISGLEDKNNHLFLDI